jgi:outer membrane protein TolC
LPNKRKPVFFLFIVLITLFTGRLFAEEKLIGLGELLELVLENNIELKLAELNLEDAGLDYKKAELNNLMSKSRLIKLQNELQMAYARKSFKDTRDGIIMDIISKYLDLININYQILTAEKEVYLEEKRVEEVKAQVEVGYKSSLELFEQETRYLSAVNSLERLRGVREQKTRELKQKAVLDDEYEIKLIELKKPEIWIVTEESVLEEALNSEILAIREKQVEIAENDLLRAKISGIPELDLKKKELGQKKAALELEKERQNIENNARNTYFQYEELVKNMNMAEKSLFQAEEHYRIIKEQNKAGLVSNNDLLSSELSFYKAQSYFIESIINYYKGVLELQRVMCQDLEVEINNAGSK